MGHDVLQDEEDAREQRFWALVLRWLWTVLIALVTLATLAGITAALGWHHYLLLCIIGLLAGVALALALGSTRSRELTGLVLGAITLPILAVWLGDIAVTRPESFAAYSERLVPFLGYAIGAALGCLGIARLWARAPAPGDSAAPEGGSP